MKNLNSNNRSKNKRRGYESLLLLLLTIALFVTATYAWFTDSAYSRGNKLFAGNLYIDIVASKEDLIAAGHSEANLADDFGTPYNRKLVGGDSAGTDYYYVTDKEANVVNIYNMEPGQYRKVSVDYLNTGDLAFKTVGALKVEEQYNAFDTLIKQVDKELEVYKNKYQVTIEATDGNVELVTKIKNAKVLFENDITESMLFNDNNNIISINGVDCFVLQFVKYEPDKNEFKACARENATHALMMTKDPVHEGTMSFTSGSTDTKYNDSLLIDVLNESYANVFNSDQGIVSSSIDYYYSPNKNAATSWENNVPLFDDETGFVTYKLDNQRLFAPDAKLFTQNSYRFNYNDEQFFFLDASYNNNGEYKALIIKDNKSGGSVGSYTSSNDSQCVARACFYYDLTEIPEASTTIDPKAIYENDNDYYTTYEGLNYDDYLYRFEKAYSRIENLIVDEANKGSTDKPVQKRVETATAGTYDNVILGYVPENYGHLSNVLEVYVTTNEEEIKKGHDSAYYFGTVDQFAYLIENGPIASENTIELTSTQFETILNTYNTTNALPSEYNTPDYMYKVMFNDKDISLYDDYQRYLACGSGYCLPIDTVTNPTTKLVDPNTEVRVYSPDVKGNYETVYASEMGSLEFLLYMPKEAGDEYQNCTLSLSLGGTATQVEYEVDDLGIMIYDKTKAKPRYNFNVGDIVSVDFYGDDLDEAGTYGRVIRKSGSTIDLALVGENSVKVPYFAYEILDEANSKNLYDISDEINGASLKSGTYIGLYKNSAINYISDIMGFELCGYISNTLIETYAEQFGGEILDDNHIRVPNPKGKGSLTLTYDEFKEYVLDELDLDIDEDDFIKGFVDSEYSQDIYELVYYKDSDVPNGLGNKEDADYLIVDNDINPTYQYGVKHIKTLDPVTVLLKPLTIKDLVDGIGKNVVTFDEIDKFIYGYSGAGYDYFAPDLWLGDGFFLSNEIQKAVETMTHARVKYPLGLFVDYSNGINFTYSLEKDSKKSVSNESGMFTSPYISKETTFVARFNLKEIPFEIKRVAEWPNEFKEFEYYEYEEEADFADILLVSDSSPYINLIKNNIGLITDYTCNIVIPDSQNHETIINSIEKYATTNSSCLVIELPNDVQLQQQIFSMVDSINKHIIYIGTCYQDPAALSAEYERINLCANCNHYAALLSNKFNISNGRFIYSYHDAAIQDLPFVSAFGSNLASIFKDTLVGWGLNLTKFYNSATDNFDQVGTNEHNLTNEFLKTGGSIDSLAIPAYVGDGYFVNCYQRFFEFAKTDNFSQSVKNPFNVYIYFIQGEPVEDVHAPVDTFNDNSSSFKNFKNVVAIYRNDANIVTNLFNQLNRLYAPSDISYLNLEPVSYYDGSILKR